MQNEPWIVTLDTEKLWVAIFAALALVLVALLLWSGRRRENPLEQLGREWLDGLYVVVGLFFLAALGATAVVLFDTFRNVAHPPATGSSPNLGAGALIAAILGAPFVIWGTVLKHQTLRYTKEGHITDRISKAVEQLGAVKTVERIGRPVTIFTGEPERVSYPENAAVKFADKPRTKLSPKEWDQRYDDVADDVEGGYWQTVSTWPEERTVIQWQGESVELTRHEAIGVEGQWDVFKETVPNIEVRIGGLLSLERISQDSVTYDKGRDHVRIMEILCAYVRNNAPASSAANPPGKDPTDLPDNATTKQKSQHVAAWKERATILKRWTKTLPKPREDIQLALSIIGRRDERQRQIEARWGPGNAPDADWVFATECPDMADFKEDDPVLHRWIDEVEQWREKLREFSGYRPDLRSTNLQGVDLEEANLSGALLDSALLQGASLFRAQLRGASLQSAHFHGTSLGETQLQGADLEEAKMQATTFWGTRIQGVCLSDARLHGAELIDLSLRETMWLSQDQLNMTSGNRSITLPKQLIRPAHWPR